MQPLKTLIVDDEWLVRSELKTILAGHPESAVAGEAANVAQAIPFKPRALVSKTLQEWEELLPEKHFVRIHRSTAINFAHVEKVKKRQMPARPRFYAQRQNRLLGDVRLSQSRQSVDGRTVWIIATKTLKILN